MKRKIFGSLIILFFIASFLIIWMMFKGGLKRKLHIYSTYGVISFLFQPSLSSGPLPMTSIPTKKQKKHMACWGLDHRQGLYVEATLQKQLQAGWTQKISCLSPLSVSIEGDYILSVERDPGQSFEK